MDKWWCEAPALAGRARCLLFLSPDVSPTAVGGFFRRSISDLIFLYNNYSICILIQKYDSKLLQCTYSEFFYSVLYYLGRYNHVSKKIRDPGWPTTKERIFYYSLRLKLPELVSLWDNLKNTERFQICSLNIRPIDAVILPIHFFHVSYPKSHQLFISE